MTVLSKLKLNYAWSFETALDFSGFLKIAYFWLDDVQMCKAQQLREKDK